jgi:hypothetical protein
MEQERRRTRERRATESDAVLVHRQHRKEIDDACRNSIKRPKMPFLSVLLIVIVITGFGLILKPENQSLSADCALPPGTKVNWSNCTFINLNVENQNLQFSLFTDAILNESNLLGANLSGADMAYAEITKSDFSYANLKNADLSFADLSNVLLAGANLSNVKFDNTIWIDGKICKKGSIGTCQ